MMLRLCLRMGERSRHRGFLLVGKKVEIVEEGNMGGK
jgi:hypothetical protein